MADLIRAPQINVNDEEMVLLEWLKEEGVHVRAGESIAVVETTKSTADLEAEGTGFLRHLVDAGEQITVGQTIGAITGTADESIQVEDIKIADRKIADRKIADRKMENQKSVDPTQDLVHRSQQKDPSPSGRVRSSSPTRTPPSAPGTKGFPWTRKAGVMARRQGLDIQTLDILPADGERIRAADLEQFLEAKSVQRVLVIGGGGAGVQILDVLSRVEHQQAVGVLDDDPGLAGGEVIGVPVLGSIGEAPKLLEAGSFDAAIISIGTRVDLRAEIFETLSGQGIPFANVVDPRAVVLSDVRLGRGNAVMPLAQIAAGTRVGDNNFISSFVDLEHHNELGSHCTFGPGVMTSGGVRIGDRVKFGAGVYIEPQLSVGSDSVVASGVVLTRSVPDHSIVKTRSNFIIRSRDV